MTESTTPAYDALSDKHKRFVNEYLIDLNATRAAIRAGYAESRARQTGCDLLAREDVAAAIARGQQKVSERAEVDVDEVVDALSSVLRANMLDYVKPSPGGKAVYLDFSQLTRDQAAVISELTVDTLGTPKAGDDADGGEPLAVTRIRFKLHDKLSAADKLLKHLGGYAPQQHEHTGKDGGPIETVTRIELVAPNVDGSGRTAA